MSRRCVFCILHAFTASITKREPQNRFITLCVWIFKNTVHFQSAVIFTTFTPPSNKSHAYFQFRFFIFKFATCVLLRLKIIMTRVMLGLAEQSTAPTSYDSSLEQGSGVVAIAWHAVSKAWGHLQGEGEVSEQHDLHGHGRHLMARVAGVGVGTFLIFFFL